MRQSCTVHVHSYYVFCLQPSSTIPHWDDIIFTLTHQGKVFLGQSHVDSVAAVDSLRLKVGVNLRLRQRWCTDDVMGHIGPPMLTKLPSLLPFSKQHTFLLQPTSKFVQGRWVWKLRKRGRRDGRYVERRGMQQNYRNISCST